MSSSSAPPPGLFFSAERDLNFLVYHLLIVLKELGATVEKPFKDTQALPLVISLVGDPVLVSILEDSDGPLRLHSRDYTRLLLAESRAKRSRRQLQLLLFALKERKIVALFPKKLTSETYVSVGLEESADIDKLVEDELFHVERDNTRRLRKVLRKLRTMRAAAIYKRLLTERGLTSWWV